MRFLLTFLLLAGPASAQQSDYELGGGSSGNTACDNDANPTNPPCQTSTGEFLAATGTAALPSFSFDNDVNTGIYRRASDRVSFALGGTARFELDTASSYIPSTNYYSALSGVIGTGISWRLGSAATGVARFDVNASTGAALLHATLVEANTAVAASPNVIAAREALTAFTNEGATAENVHNLPTAVANLIYTFVVQDADGIQINAATGDTIRIAASVSASAGLIETTTIGNTVTLLAINATEWVAIAVNGTWTVT